MAGLITVCESALDQVIVHEEAHCYLEDTTMPLDNIKTRMQSTGAETRYRNSLDCFLKVCLFHSCETANLMCNNRSSGRRACLAYGEVQCLG